MPDAATLRDLREALIGAGAPEARWAARARAIAAAGRLPRGGPIVDAPLVAAPRPRHDEGAKVPIKEGRTAAGIGRIALHET